MRVWIISLYCTESNGLVQGAAVGPPAGLRRLLRDPGDLTASISGQKRKLPRCMSGRLGSFGESNGPGKISSVSENG